MGLFNKPNSSFASGGHSFVADVIQNEGGNTGRGLIAWRDPREDFNINSKLIVRQGEEAVFENGGSEYVVFPRGEYELKTQNKVFVRWFQEKLTGGASSFPCRVYFVSTEEFNVDWYTADPIGYRCPEIGPGTLMRGGGIYVIQVVDSMKFTSKMLRDNLSYDVNMMKVKLTERIYQDVAEIISDVLETNQVISMEFSKKKRAISELCKPKVQDLLESYGVQLNDFTISLEVDEDQRQQYEQLQRMKMMDARGDAMKRAIDSQSKMQEWQTMGDAYKTIKGMEMLKDIANNPGAGGIASAGAGLGLGMAAGSAFGTIAQSVFSQQSVASSQLQPSEFRVSGGQPQQAAQPDPIESLTKMKKMLEAGLITQQDYDAKVAEILSRL